MHRVRGAPSGILFLALLLATACSGIGSRRTRIEQPRPSAVVTPESAVFVFPMPQRATWPWTIAADMREDPYAYEWSVGWDRSTTCLRRTLYMLMNRRVPTRRQSGTLEDLLDHAAGGSVCHGGGHYSPVEREWGLSARRISGGIVLKLRASETLEELRTLRPDSVSLAFVRFPLDRYGLEFEHRVRVDYRR